MGFLRFRFPTEKRHWKSDLNFISLSISIENGPAMMDAMARTGPLCRDDEK